MVKVGDKVQAKPFIEDAFGHTIRGEVDSITAYDGNPGVLTVYINNSSTGGCYPAGAEHPIYDEDIEDDK